MNTRLLGTVNQHGLAGAGSIVVRAGSTVSGTRSIVGGAEFIVGKAGSIVELDPLWRGLDPTLSLPEFPLSFCHISRYQATASLGDFPQLFTST